MMTFRKGYIPTKEHRRKLSKALMGRKLPKEVCLKMSKSRKGKWLKGGPVKKYCLICNKEFIIPRAWFNLGIGKFCSKECRSIYQSKTRQGKNSPHWQGKTIIIKCKICNKEVGKWVKSIEQGNSKFCSQSCFGKWVSKNKIGINHQNWLGGISKLPYSFDFTLKLKEKIHRRDNYQCQNCEMTDEEHLIVFGKSLCIHHIDYDKKNSKEENLITLCNQCHSRTNFNREYWKEHYGNSFRIPDKTYQ